MIGSHKLSKDAWGEEQSGNSSLLIRCFRLSVFIHHYLYSNPSLRSLSITIHFWVE